MSRSLITKQVNQRQEETTTSPSGGTTTDPAASSDPADDPRAELVVHGANLTRLIGRVGYTPEEAGLADNQFVRWYSVWYVPGHHYSRVAGIHWGLDTAAYAGLLGLNQNSFGGIRWRRFDNKAAAQEGFRAEAVDRGLSPFLSDRVVGWTLVHDDLGD